jgi:hypothetical protein
MSAMKNLLIYESLEQMLKDYVDLSSSRNMPMVCIITGDLYSYRIGFSTDKNEAPIYMEEELHKVSANAYEFSGGRPVDKLVDHMADYGRNPDQIIMIMDSLSRSVKKGLFKNWTITFIDDDSKKNWNYSAKTLADKKIRRSQTKYSLTHSPYFASR